MRSTANLLDWLFRKRWAFGRKLKTGVSQSKAHGRLSLLALSLIGLVAAAWSTIASSGFLGWDPHYYYSLVQDKTWAQVYPFEQVMFRLVTAFRPSSFPSYEFLAIAISLSVLLVAFWRLGYSRVDQLLLVFFFSCSFYGLHFVLTFQRQFFGLVFFLLAISGKRFSILARILSLGSQLFTFTVHIFWEIRRLPARAATGVVVLFVPPLVALVRMLFSDTAAHYGGYGVESPLHLVLKQALTVSFCVIVLITLKPGENPLRSLTAAYIALSLPVIVWPFYSGVFARFDYFFLPLLVALWPRYVREDRRSVSRACLIAFTTIGFALFMRLNLQCIVIGDCQL